MGKLQVLHGPIYCQQFLHCKNSVAVQSLSCVFPSLCKWVAIMLWILWIILHSNYNTFFFYLISVILLNIFYIFLGVIDTNAYIIGENPNKDVDLQV
jgi:hypothetical protein